ncbi:MAG: hypothetical protein COA79_10510 [Planctomycetota bacterium]|nr:MAG: hypothetical protein COA79_10510 [Planctomycetota bacterium]
MNNFRELGLDDKLLKILKSELIKSPTPIQQHAIPLLLNGENVIGQARTGSGKTLAFILPMLQQFLKKRIGQNRKIALILSPTRELTKQTAKVIETFSAGSKLNIITLHGGQSLKEQENLLDKRIDILNCAPGRLIDFANRGAIDLSKIQYLVVDEGDRLLELGFDDDLEYLLNHVPINAQRLMFSATFSKELVAMANQYIINAKHLFMSELEGEKDYPITYYYLPTEAETKFLYLMQILHKKWAGQTIIFVNGRSSVIEVGKQVKAKGIKSESFHANLDAVERDSALRRFKEKIIQVMVCSDLAARGLDIEGVKTVINYDLPNSKELYLHRTGRTGRAFEKGSAYTFTVNDKEIKELIDYHKKHLPVKINLYKSKAIEDTNVDSSQKGDVYYKTIVFNRGKNDKLSPGNFVGLLVNEIDIPSEEIGNINVYDDRTEIELPAKYANKAFEIIKKIKGKKILISPKTGGSKKKYKTREIATRTQVSRKQQNRKKSK